eukprot:31494-Pelagococcus_subviridis.AAC.25
MHSNPPACNVPFVSAHTVSPTWNCATCSTFRGAPFSVPPDAFPPPRDEDVSKLVRARHRVVIERQRRGDVPRLDVVRDDDQREVLSFVLDEVEALLDVADVDAVAGRVHRRDEVWEVSVLHLSQELLLPEIVQPQRVPAPEEKTAFESAHRPRDAVQRRLVHERHGAVFEVAIQMHESAVAVARREGQPDGGADGEEHLVRDGKVHVARAQRSLVPGHLDDLLRAAVLLRDVRGVDDTEARRPRPGRRFRRAKLFRGGHGELVVVVVVVVVLDAAALDALHLRRALLLHLLLPRDALRPRALVVRHGRLIRLDDRDDPAVRMHRQLPRRVPKLARRLVERVAQPLDADDAQRRTGDRDDPLRALIRRKVRRVLERFVRQRREREPSLQVDVPEPRTRRQREHRGLPPDRRANRALVSDNCPVTRSTSARRSTPFARPTLRYKPPSRVCNIRSEHGAAASACTPIVCRQSSALRDNTRTRPLRDGTDVQARDVAVRLELLDLHQLPGRVELEVDDLPAAQRDDHLTVVTRHPRDRLPTRAPPLVDALIRADVPQPARVRLQQRVVAEKRRGERRRRPEEPAVRHLLHGLADGQHQRRVHERDDDVRVELVGDVLLHREHRVRVSRQRRHRHLAQRDALPQHPQRAPRPSAAQRVHLRRLLGREVVALRVEDRAQRLDLVDRVQVAERARLEKHRLVPLVRLHQRRAGRLHVVVVVADALELIQRVV